MPRRALSAIAGAALILGALAGPAAADVSAPITGAIFTTDSTCVPVNLNVQYDDKQDVYLNGGPVGGTPFKEGSYWVQVTSPGGTVLGQSSSDIFVVDSSGQSVNGCDQLWSLVYSADSGFVDQGYDDTVNPGGVYIVAVCGNDSFAPNVCKYDAFKVRSSGPPAGDTGALVVKKYYDANGNGSRDAGEVYLSGWLMFLKTNAGVQFDSALTEATFTMLEPGNYKVTEATPNESGWVNSDPGTPTLTKNATVAANQTTTVEFGNYCLFTGDTRTIGYWKTHQAATTALLPVTLGSTPWSYTVDSWTKAFRILDGANSKDANVMLKAQLLGVLLNLKADPSLANAFVAGSGQTVQQIVDAAQAFLGTNGGATLTKDGTLRAQALTLKTWLDRINNFEQSGGATLISPTACVFTFAP